jgi:uncharacterized protein YbbC (DUF1343 family)
MVAQYFVDKEKKRVRSTNPVKLGLERLLDEEIATLRGLRVGLICNQASVDHSFMHAADLLSNHSDLRLTTLFGPQHGIRGEVQDNMVETDHATDTHTGLPIYSLYSETREPTGQMLDDVDALVFDMQDVGCRIYTFVYTMANCMRAAKRFGKRIIVCDRPNPINGRDIEGNTLDSAFESFVGQFPIPTRHGMTVGEMARMFNEHFGIRCELTVIPMQGWTRELWLDDTDAPWVMPSPNMPTLDSATVFPGTVHFEGTQISEGRGTTRPFELIGAPYIDSFEKHAGKSCGGVQIHVLDRDRFEPVTVGLATVKVAYDLYPSEFKWKEPPYEYVFDRNPFDVICGTDVIRKAIESNTTLSELTGEWAQSLEEFDRARRSFLLY